MKEKVMRLKDFPDLKPIDLHDSPDQRTGTIVSIPESS